MNAQRSIYDGASRQFMQAPLAIYQLKRLSKKLLSLF